MQLKFDIISLTVIVLFSSMCTVEAHEISLNYHYFKDDGSAIIVPELEVSLNPWAGGTVGGSISADTVSHASEYQTSEADTITGASEQEHRLQIKLGMEQEWHLWKISLGGYFSDEPDYVSRAISWSIARDFFQRNTTVSLHGNYGSDDIFSNDEPDFEETARRIGSSISLTQVLSPTVITRFTASYSGVSGYQSNPYRYALRQADSIEFDNREILPDDRNRYAFTVKANMFQEPLNAAVHPVYRYYWDDWGIASHEIRIRFLKYLLVNLISHIEVRFYTQSEADFYQEIWAEPDEYMTSYGKYSEGQTYLIAMGGRYSFDTQLNGWLGILMNGMSLRGNIGYYRHEGFSSDGIFGHFGLTWRW